MQLYPLRGSKRSRPRLIILLFGAATTFGRLALANNVDSGSACDDPSSVEQSRPAIIEKGVLELRGNASGDPKTLQQFTPNASSTVLPQSDGLDRDLDASGLDQRRDTSDYDRVKDKRYDTTGKDSRYDTTGIDRDFDPRGRKHDQKSPSVPSSR